MNKLQELRDQRQALLDEADAIVSLAEETEKDLSADETARLDEIQGKGDKPGLVAKLDEEIDRWAKVDERRRAVAAARAAENGRLNPTANSDETEFNLAAVRVPASARARGAIKSFRGESAEKEAYIAGQFYAYAMFGNEAAGERLRDMGVQAAQTTTDNTKGGYLVPDMLEATIIRNVEEYGVARRYCRVLPISGGSISIPRRSTGYTAYFVGENTAGTESDLTLDQIQLVPQKLMVLSRWSSELPEDAAVQLGDLVTQELAYAFANKEDECLFNGDGTSTYGGIVGLANALAAGSIATTASGVDTFAEITNATFEEAIGKLQRVPGIMPAWFVHQSCWANVMQRLAMAGGGNTVQNFQGGVGPSYMGYPVVISQVLTSGAPTTDISDSVFGYFGDMRMTATFGDKRGVTVATDSSLYFNSDAIALKGTERFDINVHERGDSSNAGTMVALKANAS